MKRNGRRTLAALLALIMVLVLLPTVSAKAEEEEVICPCCGIGTITYTVPHFTLTGHCSNCCYTEVYDGTFEEDGIAYTEWCTIDPDTCQWVDNNCHSGTCSGCGRTMTEPHTGGTAGNAYGPICEVCGGEYGEIEIASYDELKAFAARVNSGEVTLNAKLTADIVCKNSPDDTDYANDWTPIGTYIKRYRGTFDGQGYTITGLSNAEVDYSGLSDDDEAYIGLFGFVEGTVQNVVLEDCAFSFTSHADVEAYIGAVVGWNCGTVEGCSVSGTVSGRTTSDDNLAVGGVVGKNDKTVRNCTNTGAVFASNESYLVFCGGVVGGSSGAEEYCVNTGAVTGKGIARVGGVTGNGKSVKNCLNTGTVSGGSHGVGGIVGYTSHGTVENCLNVGTVSNGDYAGGVIGENAYGAVKTCLSVGAVSGDEYGGVVGYCPNVASENYCVENCYCLDTSASAPIGIVGAATVTNVSALSAEQLKKLSNCVGFSTDTWYEGLSYPVLKNLSGEVHLYADSNEDVVKQCFISACVPTKFANPFTYEGHDFTGWNTEADGSGDPYSEDSVFTLLPGEILTLHAQWAKEVLEIASYADLKDFAARVNAGETGLDAKLTADIVCKNSPDDTDYAKDWTPIGTDLNRYNATFDGQGHTIKGLSIADVDYSGLAANSVLLLGLFGKVHNDCVIKNVRIADCDLSITSDVEGLRVRMGAIAGYSLGTIENCSNTGNLSVVLTGSGSRASVGGLIGLEDGSIRNCFNTGAISAEAVSLTCVGGICGYYELSFMDTVEHCLNAGALSAGNYAYVGGISGFHDANSSIKQCLNVGTVSGGNDASVGGLAGYLRQDSVDECLNVGTVSGGNNAVVGSIVGRYENRYAALKNSYSLNTAADRTIGFPDSGSNVTNVVMLTAEQLKKLSNCFGFSTDTWYEGLSYPVLKNLSGEVHLYADSNEDVVKQCFISACVPTKFANPFTYEGHDFTGWNTEADGSGDPYSEDSVFTLLPGEILTLHAQWRDSVVNYPLWVGGVQINSINKDNITAAITAAGDTATGTATYDPVNCVLTLEDFTCSCLGHLDNYHAYSVLCYNGASDFTIELIGENTLVQTGVGKSYYSYGVRFDPSAEEKTVVFYSDCDGTLTSKAGPIADEYSSYGGNTAGICSYMNTVISGAHITAEGNKARNYSFGVQFNLANLTIESGSLTAKGGEAGTTQSVGIDLNSCSLIVNGGTVAASSGQGSGGSVGIFGTGVSTVSVSGGTFVAQGNTKAIDSVTLSVAEGIVTKGSASFDGTDAVTCSASDAGNYKWIKTEPLIAYPIWVGDVQVTNANAEDVLGDGGKVKFEVTEDGENVLTLTNANVVGEHPFNGGISSSSIHSDVSPLTIRLIGENTVSGAYNAIYVTSGALKLTGEGSLQTAARVVGIYSQGLTIDGTEVWAEGDAFGLWIAGGLSIVGDSKLTAKGSDPMAIYAAPITIDEGLAITTPKGGYIAPQGSKQTVYTSDGTRATEVVIEPGYTITFRNEDGTELQSYAVAAGETPVYEGEALTKAPTVEHLYTFAGWKLSGTETVLTQLPKVSGEATYVAAYTESDRVYTGPVWVWDGYESATATFTAADDTTFTQVLTAEGDAIFHMTTVEPDCEYPGVETYTAKVTFLGKDYFNDKTKEIAKRDHIWVFDEFVWTPNEQGIYTVVANFHCERYASHTLEFIPVAGMATDPATCTEDGCTHYVAYIHPMDSPDGLEHSDNLDIVIPAHGHQWSAPDYERIETETGYDVYAIVRCYYDYSHRIEETVHATYEVLTPPTLYEEGLGRYTADFEDEHLWDIHWEVVIPKLALGLYGEDVNAFDVAEYTEDGTLFRYDVNFRNDAGTLPVVSMQAFIGYDADVLTLVEAKTDLPGSVTTRDENGVFSFAWANDEGVEMASGAVVVSLYFKLDGTVQDGDVLVFPFTDGDFQNSAAYLDNGVVTEAAAFETKDGSITFAVPELTIAGEDVLSGDIYVIEDGKILYRYDVRVKDLPEAGLMINSAQIFLGFDHEILAVAKTEGVVDWTTSDDGSTFMASWASDTEAELKEDDIVLTLWFTKIGEAPEDGVVPIVFTVNPLGFESAFSTLFAGSVKEVAANTVDGSITFETMILGDANCDGEVTAADAALILRALVGLSELSSRGVLNADVDGDGEITAEDAAIILRMIVGLIDTFPAEEP